MPAPTADTPARAPYWTNVWFRAGRGYEPDTFLARQDAVENVADPIDGWTYIETIWRREDGKCEILHLESDAAEWPREQMGPCSDLARRQGCSCRMETGVYDPEPVIDRDCPLHGRDPDMARETKGEAA